jgi:vanillate O-demethylase ferredoxin subunit
MSTSSLTVRVTKKQVEAVDICSFELAHADGHPLPAFSAGSHIDVRVADGLTRQYSLCNDPEESHRYLIGVLKDPSSRGGSRGMHERIQVGDVLEISAPKNHFALAHEARKSVLLAGGIGITPILCMAERLSAIEADFEMHYCTRSRGRTAFSERIERGPFGSKVQFHFDDADASQRLDLAQLLHVPQVGTHLYVCGPKGFMDAVLKTARDAGWPEHQLHYEFFAAEVTKSDTDGSFEVKLASSGRIVVVGKEQTVVQALATAGVDVPVSCEQGVCGTCLTRVIDGTPDHRDVYLTPEEQALNDQFTPCCSRSLSARLVLDL